MAFVAIATTAATALGAGAVTSAAIGAGAGLLGGTITKGNTQQAQQQMAQSAMQEQQSYRDAQKLLQKGQDDSISSLEAADLNARGLIDDSTLQAIDRLNQAQGGAIATMKQFAKQSTDIFASAQQDTVKNLVNSGLLAKDSVNGATLQAIQNVTGWDDKAFQYITGGNDKAIQAIKDGSSASISSLQPYADAGKAGLEKSLFLGGMLPPDQAAEAAKHFGNISDSPIYQFQLSEAEKASDRERKASGNMGSGFGAELAQKARLQVSSDESARQIQEAQSMANLGYGAASQISSVNQNAANQIAGYNSQTGQLTGNLAQQTGNTIAGLNANAGNTIANQQSQTGQQLAAYNNQYGSNLANTNNTLGQNTANLQYSTGASEADIAQQALLNKARMASLLGTNISNLQSSGATQQANIGIGAANQNYNQGVQQAQIGYQANMAPWQGVTNGINAGLQYNAQQQANQVPTAQTNYASTSSPYYVAPGLGTTTSNTGSYLGQPSFGSF